MGVGLCRLQFSNQGNINDSITPLVLEDNHRVTLRMDRSGVFAFDLHQASICEPHRKPAEGFLCHGFLNH